MNFRANISSGLFGRALTSYRDSLRRWLSDISAQYVLALGLILLGVVSLLVATGVAAAAAFHYIAEIYGVYRAYESIGGGFLLLGLVAIAMGRSVLGRPLRSLPSPQPQIRQFKRSVLAAADGILVRPQTRRADPLTQLLAIGAAATLLGWMITAHINVKSGQD
jgi:hypothetical protein